jgi:hypothetical protein
MTAHDSAEPHSGQLGLGTSQRVLMWLVLSVLAALVVYLGFRGYVSPDFLFHFVSGLHC